MSEKKQQPKFYDFVNVYEFTCELPGSGDEIKFKPVSTAQLKRLLTYENEKNFLVQEMALDEMISSSVLSENFSIDDLYLEDRFFLLVELRKKTKGEILEFTVTCPKCKSQSLNRINLDEMPVESLNPNVDKTVKLQNGIIIHLKHVRRGDQRQIRPNVISKKMTEIQQQAEIQTLYHAVSIDKIILPDGTEEGENLTVNDKKYLIDNIPTGEYEKIKDKLDEMTFGVDLSYEVTCRSCEYKHKTSIPIENNFFG
jgi:hypothetical protein